jgi:hypothetical protein
MPARMMAADFLVVPTVTFRVLFVLVVLGLEVLRRCVEAYA